jgi:pimeloyl-ACP methyl ester carboxylesterase
VNIQSFKWLQAGMAVVCICTPFLAARADGKAGSPPPQASPNGIDEGRFININGLDQWVTIRGQNLDNPVLLYLHGGPGMGSSITALAFSEWEKYFTFVQWDQPGGGFTQMKSPTAQGTMTIARYTKDGIAVTEAVLARLHKKRLVVMGNSWGTLIGLEMVHARPELFSAYVGSSQAIGDAGNKLGYELALQAARERKDTTGIAALEHVGPPPYEKFEDFFTRQQYSNPPGLPASDAETANSAEFWGHLATPPSPDAQYLPLRVLTPEQMSFDQTKMWMNFVEVQKQLFHETWAWEARSLGMKYPIPVFVYEGDRDFNTPAQTAHEWVNDIEAPAKGFEIIPGASHNTIVFQKDLLRMINRDVRPLVQEPARVARH